MPPQELPPQAQQGAPAQEDGPPSPPEGQDEGTASPKEIVSEIHSGMMALKSLLDQSQGISDQEKQAFDQIISQYQAFVNNVLGAESGSQEGQSNPPSPQGPVPTESGGNPNARPM